MKHAVVGLIVLLTLVNVSRAKAEASAIDAPEDSAATATFSAEVPEGMGPHEKEELYDVVCEDMSNDLLVRESIFVDMLVEASARIPASLGLHHIQYDCTEVRFYLGTVIQVSSGEYFASLFTLSQEVSATDTDEQLSHKVDAFVERMIAKDIAAKTRQAAKKAAEEPQPKTGV